MFLYGVLLLVGLAVAGDQKDGHHDDCTWIKGVGPGYEKSHLDYSGKFKGGARKFLPIYERVKAHQKEEQIRGGCGAHDCPHHDHGHEERQKRGSEQDHKDCGCLKGVGPGYEKSHLDYEGKFTGGARKFLPIYERVKAHEKEVRIRGGCGAHDCPHHGDGHDDRQKRGADDGHKDCGCLKGVGPGYEKSHLDYEGKFKGGARKFLPIYERVKAHQEEEQIRGGCGAHDCPHHEERHKRSVDHKDCGCLKGVGPGYEKSYLDYAGKFKGGARKFLPIYERVKAHQEEEQIRGGCGAHDCPHHEERHKRNMDCSCIKGVGPGYEKSYLDYAGKFKGGARKFLPIYEKVKAQQKEEQIRGGCGAHDCPHHEERHKRSVDHKDCGCLKGVGPGYEKSHLDYSGKFKGGARKFLPIYERVKAHQEEEQIRGGCGAHDCPHHEERHKRSEGAEHKDCGCLKGVGPGYEKSHLDYSGKFKGGARKFLPIYERVKAHEEEVQIRGGCGAHDCPHHEERHKRSEGAEHKDCGCIKGVGPGYEKSHLDYSGKFKGGARKFLPIYERVKAHEEEVQIRGGCGAHDCPHHEERHKRSEGAEHKDCGCIKGVGPGYEKSHLDYDGHFKGGARKFLPIYEKQHGKQHEVSVKGGAWHHKPCHHCDHQVHHEEKHEEHH